MQRMISKKTRETKDYSFEIHKFECYIHYSDI